jgi:hypothetical protein
MTTLRESGWFRRLSPGLLIFMVLGAALAGCGGSDDDDGDSGNPPGPPPPPPPTLPPLSATVIDIDDDHQVGVDHWPSGNTSTGGQGDPVNGMECLVSQSNTFHQHTHVSIFLNGEQLSLPSGIGFVLAGSLDCHYPLHTHDKSGLIHQHGTSPQNFTLGQVFDIWGQPLESANFAGETGLPVVVYLTDNGVVSLATGNLRDIALNSHREITVQIGTPITEIPQYSWTGN